MARSRFRRLLVSVVALLAVVAGAPGPAGAAPRGAAQLRFPAEVILPLKLDAKRVLISSRIPEDHPLPFPGEAHLTLDLTDLVGVATVTPFQFWPPRWTCESVGTTLDCVASGWLGELYVDIAPVAEAEEGDIAQMRLSLTVPGLKPATGSMAIKTVSVVDLADASGQSTTSGVPGDDITWPVRVRNASDVPVDGVVVLLTRPYRVRFTERHSNCEYTVWDYGRIEQAACHFDTTVPPGATFEVSPIPPMRIAADAAGGWARAGVDWFTSFDWARERVSRESGTSGFTPGTGPPLRLVEAASPRVASETEIDRNNNHGSLYVEVHAQTKADEAAVPATITGRLGETVRMRFGSHNYGPTSVDWSDAGEPVVWLQVTVPPGVTVTEARRCGATRPRPAEGSGFEPGAAEYLCADSGYVHPAGETIWWEFTLRIDRRVPGAEGRLAIRGFPDMPSRVSWDPNPANDTAPLKVRVLGDDSGGGGAGGLPITGGDTRLIAMVGAALLILGALAVTGPRYWRRIITPRASRVRD